MIYRQKNFCVRLSAKTVWWVSWRRDYQHLEFTSSPLINEFVNKYRKQVACNSKKKCFKRYFAPKIFIIHMFIKFILYICIFYISILYIYNLNLYYIYVKYFQHLCMFDSFMVELAGEVIRHVWGSTLVALTNVIS